MFPSGVCTMIPSLQWHGARFVGLNIVELLHTLPQCMARLCMALDTGCALWLQLASVSADTLHAVGGAALPCRDTYIANSK